MSDKRSVAIDAEQLAGKRFEYQEDISLVEDLDLMELTPGKGLGIDCDGVFHSHGPQLPLWAICFASMSLISDSARSSLTPGM